MPRNANTDHSDPSPRRERGEGQRETAADDGFCVPGKAKYFFPSVS